MKTLEITNAAYLDDYKIWLKFNDGTTGIADLSSELFGEVFEPLKDPNFFKLLKLKFGTIAWPNDADFAPEFLYDLVHHQNK